MILLSLVRLPLRLVRVVHDEHQWWRDARAARQEFKTLGCRSNAELDAALDRMLRSE